MNAEIMHALLAAAERAARESAGTVSDEVHLREVAIAMAEVGDPAGAGVVAELEVRLAGNEAYLATLYARLGRRADVDRLCTIVEAAGMDRDRRRFLIEAFERLGDTARADALAADLKEWALVYRADAALERGDRDGSLALTRAWIATLDPGASGFLGVASRLRRLGDREAALDYVRRTEDRWLPQPGVDLGESLAHIATAYAELGALEDAVRVARTAEARAGEYLKRRAKGGATRRKHRPDYVSRSIPSLARIHELAGDHAHACFLIDHHVREIRRIKSTAFEAEAARYYVEIGERAKAERWFQEPFQPPWPGEQPRSVDDLDRLHAGYVTARLVLGEAEAAIDHAAQIVEPARRVEPILEIARWVRAHELHDPAAIEAALSRLAVAPVSWPPGWMPS